MAPEFISLEKGWEFMENGVDKVKKILEGDKDEEPFESEKYILLYTKIYNMCIQKPPHDYSQQLYEKYGEAITNYTTETVLPVLREKHDEYMLKDLSTRWFNHKVMVKWLYRFFDYLDRYFIARRSLPTLREVGFTCFHDKVYNEMQSKAKDAVLALVSKSNAIN